MIASLQMKWFPKKVQKCRKICGLGCMNRTCARARVTQPSPCIYFPAHLHRKGKKKWKTSKHETDPRTQLVDEIGCITRPKIMSRFQKIKNFGPSATVVSYAYFQAFKFPDSMNVHFQCVIQGPNSIEHIFFSMLFRRTFH